MNTREQLIFWHDDMVEQVPDEEDRNDLFSSRIKLLEKLIAERPYEPGETILVGGDVDELLKYPMKRKYIASWEDKVIVESRISGVDLWPYSFHKPLSKTYRLKPVPEEIINDAKDARKAFRLVADTPSEVKGFKTLEWLANPDNWEK